MKTKYKAAVFGLGKISSHLPHIFKFLSCDFIYCGKSYDFKLKDLEDSFDKTSLNGHQINNEIKYIFLAVPDQLILNAFNDLKEIFPKNVIFFHLSGSMYFDQIIGVHPLMTFNSETKIEDYDKISIYTDNESFYSDFKTQVKYLNYISPANKGVYHAMASMLGNFTQYYLYTLKNNFPEGISFESYEQLVLASVTSMFQKDEHKKLTGPLIRGDIDTIEKHKSSLKQHHPKLLDIYQRFENLFFEEIKS